MDLLITDQILKLLLIATTFSIILMALIQKFKSLQCVNKNCHILLLNLIFSMSIGSFFAMYFYDLSLISSLWVGFFSFIEAPAIYDILKRQNIINYTPKALNNTKDEVLTIPIENKITRE